MVEKAKIENACIKSWVLFLILFKTMFTMHWYTIIHKELINVDDDMMTLVMCKERMRGGREIYDHMYGMVVYSICGCGHTETILYRVAWFKTSV